MLRCKGRDEKETIGLYYLPGKKSIFFVLMTNISVCPLLDCKFKNPYIFKSIRYRTHLTLGGAISLGDP